VEQQAPKPSRRYLLLDELRGLAVVAMVLYHALFLLGVVFGYSTAQAWHQAVRPTQPFIAGTFILVCGICSRLSRSNLKRGLKLAGFALGLTAGTFLIRLIGIDLVILFGILHFLAAAILLFCLAQKPLDKIPALMQVAIFSALFFVTANLTLPASDNLLLFIVGFPTFTWQSADYFPLIPWLFLFLTGTAIGAWGKQGHFPQWFDKPRCAPLRWAGRHAIWIYLAHQPMMFALVMAWQWITSFFA